MLRITAKEEGKTKRVLYLEGKICQEWRGELKAEISRGLKAGKKVVLDFSKVCFLDQEAADMINRFPHPKVRKRNGSLFIRTILKMKSQEAK